MPLQRRGSRLGYVMYSILKTVLLLLLEVQLSSFSGSVCLFKTQLPGIKDAIIKQTVVFFRRSA